MEPPLSRPPTTAVTVVARPEPTLHQRRLAGLITIVVFVLLLAGTFGLERLGMPAPFPVPERVIAALGLVVLLGPVILAEQRLLPPTGRIPGARAIACLFVVLLGSTLWSRPSPGLVEAIWDVVVLLICLGFLAFALRLSRDTVVTAIAMATLVAGTIYAVAGLAAPAARVAAFGGGPNVFARVTGIGILAGIFLASRQVGRRRGYLVALIPVMAVATVLSGSRGAMAGASAGTLALAATLPRRAWRRIIFWTILATPVLLLVNQRFGASVSHTVQTRIIRLTLQERYTSGRAPVLQDAWALFLERPFHGWGIHGFEALRGADTGFTYPHNLVLQLAAETGLLGLTAFAAVLIVTVATVRRGLWREPTVAWALASATLVLVASQFSGDYYDSRFAWVFLLIALSASRLPGTDRRAQLSARLPAHASGVDQSNR